MGWFLGKFWSFGSNRGDRIIGGDRNDIVFGFGGNDDIRTGAGRDLVFAGSGDDTIDAGSGDDRVYGGRGNDLIYDGAGSDTVRAGRGDDTVVFVAADNVGETDNFNGGSGRDTLRLELTTDEWSEALREEVQAFLAFVAANTGSNGETNGKSFTFDSLGLTVSRFETLEIFVDGVLTDPDGPGNSAPTVDAAISADVTENDASSTISLLDGAQDADEDTLSVGSLVLVRGDDVGVTQSANGNSLIVDPDAYDTLAEGQTEIVEFAYVITDGNGGSVDQTAIVTITGTNDAATISGEISGAVEEDGTLIATGQLNVMDVDTGEASFIAQVETAGAYGSFDTTVDGAWTYRLDNDNADVQALGAGGTLTEEFVVTSFDGTASETVKVTISGANDAASFAGVRSLSVREDGTLSDSITVDVIDIDSGEDGLRSETIASDYGSFSVESDGTVTYQLDNDLAEVQGLDDGEILQDSAIIQSIDGQTVEVNAEILGTTDVISGPISATLQLTTDTGKSDGDKVTSVFGFQGSITGFEQATRAELEITTNAGIAKVDLLPLIGSDGFFTVGQAQIETVFADLEKTLVDGLYQAKVALLTADGGFVQSDILAVQFDATSPVVIESPQSTDFAQTAPDRLILRFDEPVEPLSLAASDVRVTDVDGGIITVGSIIAKGPNALQINLAETLSNGSYQLTIEGNGVSDAAGNRTLIEAPIEFDVVAPTRIASISPSDDTDLVNLDRKISIYFDRPVDADTITDQSVQILAPDGAQIEGSLRVSSNGLKVSFFLDEGVLLPASSTVRVVIDGEQILDTSGQRVDADGDGIAGGIAITDFQTVSVSPVAGTNIEGFIFDSNRRGPDGEDVPLVGVVVSVIGLPEATVVTDETGRFFLENMPVPDAFVEFDASAVEADTGFRYGTVTKPVHTTAGQTTQLALGDGTPFNIYLASLSTADAVALSEDGETTVGLGADGIANLTGLFPDIDPVKWADLTVTVPEGSLFFDDGTPATQATILAFEPDRIPAPLPQGYDPDFVFTLTAGGAKNFDSNAQVTFPNLGDLPPGARRPILSFDHDAGKWVQTGTAVVSADGSVLSTEGEGGVNTLGWKFLGPTATSQHTEGPSAVGPGSGTSTGGSTTSTVPTDVTATPISLPDNRLDGFTAAGENVVDGVRNGAAGTIQVGLAGVAIVDAALPTEAAPNPVDAALAGGQSILGLLATGLDPDTMVTGADIADAGISTAASLTPGVDQIAGARSAYMNGSSAFTNANDSRESFVDSLGNVFYAATADAPSDVFGERALEIAENGPIGPSGRDINRALNPDGFPDENRIAPQNLKVSQDPEPESSAPSKMAAFSFAVFALEDENHVLLPLVEDTIQAASEQIIAPGRLANITGTQSLQAYLLRDGVRISAELAADSEAAQAVGNTLSNIAALVPDFDLATAMAADAFRASVSAIDLEVLSQSEAVAAFQAAQTAYSGAIEAAFVAFNEGFASATLQIDLAIELTFDATNASALAFLDNAVELAGFLTRTVEIGDDYTALVAELAAIDGSEQSLLDLQSSALALEAKTVAFKADLLAAGFASIDEFNLLVLGQAQSLETQLELALSPFVDSYNPLFAQAILADGTVIRARLAPGEDFNVTGPVGTDAILRFFDPATNLFSERTITFGEDNTEGRSTLSIVLTEDRDGDGIPDLGEEVIGTNPDSADSDGDGTLDGVEIRTGGVSANDAGTLPTGIVGSVAFSGEAQDVVVLPTSNAPGENFALVAAGTGGLVVVNVGQATTPSLVRQISLPGEAIAIDVDLNAGLALVAAGEAGLHVLDVGNPSAPLLLRTIQDVGPITAVSALGGPAIVGGDTSLSVVDPSTGAVLDSVAIDGPSRDVSIDDLQVVGDVVFTVERGARREIADERFEVSATLVTYRIEAGSLTELDRLVLPVAPERKIEPEPFKVFVDGPVAYVSTGLEVTDVSDFRPLERGGYMTISVADPDALSVISNVDTGNNQAANFETITNGAGMAIVAAGSFGVQLFDASNPGQTFQPITIFDTPGNALGVALADGLAYVADGEGGLQIVNIISEGLDNTAPIVEIELPEGTDSDPTSDGVQVVAGSVIPLDLDLSDDGQINRVSVLVDGEVQSTLLKPPFAPTVFAPSLGDDEASRVVTIEVRAQDAGGLTTVSNSVTVEIVEDLTGPSVLSLSIVEGQSIVPNRATTVEVVFDSYVSGESVVAGALQIVPDGGDAIPAQSVTLQAQADGTSLAIFGIAGLPAGDYTISFDPAGIADLNGNLSTDVEISRSAVVADFTNVWTATEAGDWSDGANWSNGVLPGLADRALVDTSPGVVAQITSVVDPIDTLVNAGSGQLEINAAGFPTVFEAQNVTNDGMMVLRDGRVTIIDRLNNTGTFEVVGDGRLEFDGTDIVNSGTIRLANEQAGAVIRSGTIDIDGASVFLSGGGVVELDANPNQFTSNISGVSNPGSQTFTNADNTITGTGSIGPDFGFVNGAAGVLRGRDGDRLLVATGFFENDGLVIAEVGGEVAVESVQFNGSPFAFRGATTIDNFDGVFEANGGVIDLTDSLLRGGTLTTNTVDGQEGVIRIGQSDSFPGSGFPGFEGIIGNVVADAKIEVEGDISITGNFSNTGTTTLQEGVKITSGNFFFDFLFAQLRGGGTIEMQSGLDPETRSVIEIGARVAEFEEFDPDNEEEPEFGENLVIDVGTLSLLEHTVSGSGLIGIENVEEYLSEEFGYDNLFPEDLLDRRILDSPDFSGDLFEARVENLIDVNVFGNSQILADIAGETLTIANASVFSLSTLKASGGTLEFVNVGLGNNGDLIAENDGTVLVSVAESFLGTENFSNGGSITVNDGHLETEVGLVNFGTVSILSGSAVFQDGISTFISAQPPAFVIGDANVEISGSVNSNTVLDLSAGTASVTLDTASQYSGDFVSFTDDDELIFNEFLDVADVTLTASVVDQDILLMLDDGVTVFTTNIVNVADQVLVDANALFELTDIDGSVVLTTLLTDPFA